MSTEKDLNAYTSEGRILQIEYAMKASNLGTTTIGISCKSSAVLVSERKIVSSLQCVETLNKHAKIYDNIAVSYSGIGSDAREIIKKAREYCLNHERIYNELPILEGLLKYLCSLALKFTEKELSKKIFSRPFGVNMLFAAYEKGESYLYLFDPSGSYRRLKAKGIGSAAEAVEQELKSLYGDSLSNEESVSLAVKLLSSVMKDPATVSNIEICVVDDKGVKIYSPDEIRKYL